MTVPLNHNFSPLGLQASPGQTLSFVGGEVLLDGGILGTINGRVEIGSLGSGFVELKPTETFFTLIFPDVNSFNYFNDVLLKNQSLIRGLGTGNNTISIYGNNVNILDGSVVTLQNLGTIPDNSLNINAKNSLFISGFSIDKTIRSGLITEALNTGKGGDLFVLTTRLTLEDNGGITTVTYGKGEGGNITIDTAESITVKGSFQSIPRQSIIAAVSFGSGNGGRIDLVSSNIVVEELGTIATSAFSEGNGGNLKIVSSNLTINNGGSVVTSTYGEADGGKLNVTVIDEVKLNGLSTVLLPTLFPVVGSITESPSLLYTFTLGKGDANDFELKTSQLILQDGANVGSFTFGSGNGGNVVVNAETQKC